LAHKTNRAAHTSSNDYDLYILNADGTSIVAAGDNTQDGDDEPFESVEEVHPGERIVIWKANAAAPRYLRLSCTRNPLEFQTAGQTIGHAATANSICVASSDASAVAPGPFTTSSANEDASSDGPHKMFYRPDGTPITPGNFLASGRKMQVGYSGSRGTVGRYLCQGRRDEPGSGSCFSMGRLTVDQVVVEQVLEAIAPAGVEAALQAQALDVAADEEKRRALELALERARYEAQRAKRQYDLVDPENRLVASALEARWNRSLQAVAELETRRQTLPQVASSISAEQKKQLLELGENLPRLWNDPQAPVELKKQILRTVLVEIVVQSGADSPVHRLQIHWAGGVHTELIVPRNKPGLHRRQAGGQIIELVRELVKVCDDRMIAITLNRLGHRTGQGNNWNVSRVSAFRHTHALPKFEQRTDWITLEQAARALNVSTTAVQTLIRKGILPARQVVECAPWIIERKDLDLPAVQAATHSVQRGRRLPPTVPGQAELTLSMGSLNT
jgi:hypothetical protein